MARARSVGSQELTSFELRLLDRVAVLSPQAGKLLGMSPQSGSPSNESDPAESEPARLPLWRLLKALTPADRRRAFLALKQAQRAGSGFDVTCELNPGARAPRVRFASLQWSARSMTVLAHAIRPARERPVKEASAQAPMDLPTLIDAWRELGEVGGVTWRLPDGAASFTRQAASLLGVDSLSAKPGFQTYLAHVHPADLERVRGQLETCIATDAPFETRHSVITPTGEERLVVMRGRVDRDGLTGERVFVASVHDTFGRGQDARKLQSLLEEAQQANEAKNRFLSTVSHEIRTPASLIVGVFELLGDMRLPRAVREHVQSGRQAALVLSALIDDVLDLARIEAGQAKLAQDRIDLEALVRQVSDLMQPSAQASGSVITIEFDESAPRRVIGDQARIRQVLLNLLSNAVKYAKGADVLVSLSSEFSREGRPRLCFSVSDNGPGVAANLAPVLFQPFTRGGDDHGEPGAGLGLAICRELTELLGGEIGYHPRPEGGSQFWFKTPVEVLPDAPDEKPLAAPEKIGGRVLLAEDSSTNAMVAAAILRRAGAKVDIAADGRLAAEAAAHEAYDLILMDLCMPDMDGLDAARAIRQGGGPNSLTPIVAMTANASERDVEACVAAGMDDFLAKPAPRPRLLQIVDAWVGRRSQFKPEAANWSPQTLQEQWLDDHDGLRDTLACFLRESKQRLLDARRALAQDDLAALRKSAHALKGEARTVGAGALSECAARLEAAAQAGNPMAVKALLGACASLRQDTAAQIEAAYGPLQPSQLGASPHGEHGEPAGGDAEGDHRAA